MNDEVIYLDHAAATPVDAKVLAAMQPFFSDAFYNPSAPYSPAVKVRREYEAAKQVIARAIGTKADDLVMTAGATESINLAFSGVSGHVVTSEIEHHAVLAAAKRTEPDLRPELFGAGAADSAVYARVPDKRAGQAQRQDQECAAGSGFYRWAW